ncbi:MAG TPA: MgtC/SapB family protein [Myxococcota bacterium]
MEGIVTPERLDLLRHLLVAVTAGSVIGLERRYHGRPAGFRTHALVCLASSLLMLVTIYQEQWFGRVTEDVVRLDPTRMAQGVMTGIGFLGAGVIMREGASVRGLTTAASIWTTAAIGILAGAGMYEAVLVATLLALGILSGFRLIEARMPTHHHALHVVRFRRDAAPDEAALRALVEAQGFSISSLGYRQAEEWVEYRMVIRTLRPGSARRLASALARQPGVTSFRIAPSGD